MFKRPYAVIIVAALVLFSAMGGLLIGAMSAHTKRFPFSTINKIAEAVTERARGLMRMAQAPSSERLQFMSIHVPLEARVIDVPQDEGGGMGGGLTSIGNHVVLLTYDGRTFAATPDGTLTKLDVAPPENGLDAYMKASKRPPYDSYTHNFLFVRYNDIAYFEGSAGAGLLVSYTKYHDAKECYTTSIARTLFKGPVTSPDGLKVSKSDWTDIFETAPCLPLKPMWRAIEGHMAGARIAVDATASKVYLASGDYHWDGVYGPLSPDPQSKTALAQDPSTDYGKVIAIDIATGASTRITLGQRNMQGIAIDRAGEVWTVEHGPRGGDELNHAVSGANYGWPLETYGTAYNGLPWPGTISPLGRHETYLRPTFSWVPSVGISGLKLIKGFHESWDGDLLAGSLSGRRLVRIRLGEGRVIFEEEIPIGERIRYVHQHTDGSIVLWTDSFKLFFLTPRKGGLGAEYAQRYVDEEFKGQDDRRAKLLATIDACSQCHSLNPGESISAPSLAKVFGAGVGSTSFAGYSEALKSSSQTWDPELLAAFLKDPQAAFPGTVMPNPQLSEEDRADIIKFLEAISSKVE